MEIFSFNKKNISEIIPGLIFAFVLIMTLVLPRLIINNTPRYYAGDPSFNVELYKQQSLNSLREGASSSFRNSLTESQIVLPPKVVSRQTMFYVGLVSSCGFISFIWGLTWSVYAYLNRKTFHSKRIIWITFFCFLVYRAVFVVLIAMGGIGLG